MSYLMDFESDANVKDDDMVMKYDGGFQLVCDSKSLLYLFGMHLDFRCDLQGKPSIGLIWVAVMWIWTTP